MKSYVIADTPNGVYVPHDLYKQLCYAYEQLEEIRKLALQHFPEIREE